MGRLFLIAALLVISSKANAEVVYDNISTSQFGASVNFNGVTKWAQKFYVGSSWGGIVGNGPGTYGLEINLFKSGSTSATYSIAVYDSSGSNPGNQVFSIATNQNWSASGSAADEYQTYGTVNAGTTLNAGYYFLVVESSASSSSLQWAKGDTSTNYNSPITGGGTLNSLSFNGTNWTSSTNSLGAKINVSVPEPGTLLLGGMAAACGGGGVWWRRKRKAAPVVEEEASTAV